MNDFDFSSYDFSDISPSKVEKKPLEAKKEDSTGFDFSEYDYSDISTSNQGEEEESFGKSAFRTAYQPASGLLQATPYGILTNLWQALARGEIYDPEEVEHLEKIAAREGFPFDKEEYFRLAEKVLGTVPTVGNIEREVEERTGLPLEAKTGFQKALSFGASAGKLSPGSFSQKAVAGGTGSLTKVGLEETGLPEPVAELGGLGASIATGKYAPNINITKATKPSGMPKRQFEKLENPKEVSAKKIENISEKIEGDFKKISDDIISKTPIEKTRSQIRDNPSFKNEIREKFKDVEKLSENLPGKTTTNQLKKDLEQKLLPKKGQVFTPSEYDQEFNNFIKKMNKDTPSQEIGASDLVKQYRKNNKSLSEAYDPQRPYSFNRAKKDALLEHNRTIAETIEKQFPDSEFSKLFKETNKEWANIADAEAIDKFVDGIFNGKIRFDKAKKFFENENYSRPFKRALGEEGFKDFEVLMKDMLETEKPFKMLKVAKSKGFGDLAETAGAFILHPTLGKLKLGYEVGKRSFKSAMNSILDKPQLIVNWKNGVENLSKGNFSQAEKDFSKLSDNTNIKKQEALKKFNEKNKKPLRK
jgi:hypothetical protein